MLACAATVLGACSGSAEAPLTRAEAAVAVPSASAVPAPTAQAGASLAPGGEATGPSSRLDVVPVSSLSLGAPLYPGAGVDGDTASRIELAGSTTLMLTLRSADPVAEVAAYYRQAMRAPADGVEFAEIGAAAGAGGATFVRADTATGHAVQVQVSPAGGGSLIQIVDTRSAR